ncbi:MAG: ASKHA domain-containing protein [Pseudomonadales bacterium]
MSIEEFKVVFTPSGRRGTFPSGTPILEAAQSLGVDIDSVCGGRGMCGRCQILCAEGSFAKHNVESKADHLSPFSDTERNYSTRRKELKPGRRLGCHALLRGDVVIDVPPESQVHRQLVRKDAEQRDISLHASVLLYSVQVEEADMHNPSGDLQRLKLALETEWELTDLHCDAMLLPHLQGKLREGNWFVTVAIYSQAQSPKRIIAVWPGLHEHAYGVAIDVGSTTVAAHLCSLSTGEVLASSSLMNPQIRFGEDLMSRVSYIMMHPEGAVEMTQVIRAALNELLVDVSAKANVTVQDVLEVCLVANPVMHHILLGINPIELGGAPFALATDDAVYAWASELDLAINPGGRVYVLPCIAGHVGADTAGVILAEAPQDLEETSLVVDVGTNAEIVLGNNTRMLACSSPTGPAFEGAQISCGQRAAMGAIERVRIDPKTKEPRFKVIGCDLWSNDPDFPEQSKSLGVTGICGSGIVEVVAEMYLAGIITEDGVVDGSLAETTERIIAHDRTFAYVLHDGQSLISVTQNDVRQIQLAKAALYAGVKLLMDRMGTKTVDRIRLAGAFGSHIDVKHAMVLGLIPDCALENVSSAGNAAGTGARIALLNATSREIIEQEVRRIEKIETAVEPKFQEYFVNAMAFPNKTDEFPNLFFVVPKPEPKESTSPTTDTGRKRRRRKR